MNQCQVIGRNLLMAKKSGGRLPSEYQEVEWIEGIGCYIDTNFFPNQDTSIDCEIILPLHAARDSAYAAYGSWSTSIVGFWSYDFEYFLAFGSPYYHIQYSSIPEEGDYHIVSNKNKYYINEMLVNEFPVGQWQNTLSIGLFCTHAVGGFTNQNGYVKIKHYKIKDDDTVVRDYIPCYRKSDNEIGMYDTVSGTFFTNQGTGTFTKGADVN